MKIIVLLVSALSFLGLVTYSSVKKDAAAGEPQNVAVAASKESLSAKGKTPVLVELFTSEGCSSCPPADKNLAALSKQANGDTEIITLGMHVDYWNNLGWNDPFSAAKFSQRQSFYSDTFKLDGVYTPQMVVDGTYQFVGGNSNEAAKAIAEAVKTPKANVELAATGSTLKVKISDLPEHTFANVFLAIAEDNLSSSVKRGENGGRVLSHTSVVRELRTIGSFDAAAKNFETETTFQIPANWKRENIKLVVFAQTEKTSRIIGVNQIKL